MKMFIFLWLCHYLFSAESLYGYVNGLITAESQCAYVWGLIIETLLSPMSLTRAISFTINI